jgi:hypothetical protein
MAKLSSAPDKAAKLFDGANLAAANGIVIYRAVEHASC